VSASTSPTDASASTPVAQASGSSDPSGATLPFTGEPSWIPLVGESALGLGGLTGLMALGLRIARRRFA